MKLKNKLLPLVGVATACAAVAPIALTSCKSNNEAEWVDLMTKYTPSVKALDNQTATTTEANKLYFGDETDGWKSDEDVIAQFKDDYCWSKYNFVEEHTGYYSKYTTAKVKFDEFYVAHQTYTPSPSKTIDPYKITTLSFKMEYEWEVEENWGTGYTKDHETDTITCVNVPYCISYSRNPLKPWDEENVWLLCPNHDILEDNEASESKIIWSYNYLENQTRTYYSEAEGSEIVTESNKNLTYYTGIGTPQINDLVTNYAIQAISHYLYSVQHAN